MPQQGYWHHSSAAHVSAPHAKGASAGGVEIAASCLLPASPPEDPPAPEEPPLAEEPPLPLTVPADPSTVPPPVEELPLEPPPLAPAPPSL